MIQKEVNEIKKTMKFTDCSIRRIVGCYVDPDCNLHMIDNVNFLTLPEDEQHKYFDLIKKGLSGKVGKKLLNVSFISENGKTTEKRDKLLNIIDAGKSENYDLFTENIEELYSEINKFCNYTGNYFIMTVYGVYDVPGRASDGFSMEDASDCVYNFSLTLICPIKASKAGLTYNTEVNSIENATRNMLIEPPNFGFLYPAFDDRTANIHNLLFYTKKPESIDELLLSVLGCEIPSSSVKQNKTFLNAVESSGELTFEKAKAVYSNIRELDDSLKDSEENPIMDMKTAERILEDSGFNEEEIKVFSESIKNEPSSNELLLGNIFDGSKKLKIKTGTAEVSVPVDSADFVEFKKVDGKNCIVITVNDSLSLNDLQINSFKDLL